MNKFTTIKDITNIQEALQELKMIKDNPLVNKALGYGKAMVLLFFNPSLRTRLSTQKAAQNLGLSVMVMDASNGWKLEFETGVIMNSDKAEHIKEAAAVLSQYADVIGVRSFPSLSNRTKDYQDLVLQKLVQYASVPVVNLESAIRHRGRPFVIQSPCGSKR